jgi:hypothetical protein
MTKMQNKIPAKISDFTVHVLKNFHFKTKSTATQNHHDTANHQRLNIDVTKESICL